MQTQRCPKCQHLRAADATAPGWQCPACGVAYAKVEAALERSPHSAAEVRAVSSPQAWTSTLWAKAVMVLLVGLLYWGGKTWLGPSNARGGQGLVEAVEIYTTSYCSTCKVAKAYMDQRAIAYTEHDVEQDIDKRREFYARGGQGTPLIFVHGQRMHGFDAGKFERLWGRTGS